MGGPVYSVAARNGAGSQQILINVTRSASSFATLGEGLKRVLGSVFRNSELGIIDVNDFGAGKYRSDPFILSCGKNVCAVEFEEVEASPIAIANLKKCRRYGDRFRKLTPEQFAEDPQRFDLALVAHVLTTMPHLQEREEVLNLLHEKVKEGKYLLWFAHKEDPWYMKRLAEGKTCGDGVWLGEGRQFQTFYRYYSESQVHQMMQRAGFVPFKRFSVETSNAVLYQRG